LKSIGTIVESSAVRFVQNRDRNYAMNQQQNSLPTANERASNGKTIFIACKISAKYQLMHCGFGMAYL